MKRGGPTLPAGLAAFAIGGGTCSSSEVTWLQMPAAMVMLIGVALTVAGIATPEFLEGPRRRSSQWSSRQSPPAVTAARRSSTRWSRCPRCGKRSWAWLFPGLGPRT